MSRISQDGVRVRVGAGTGDFRREERLKQLLGEAREHVTRLREQIDLPASIALSKRQRGARKRAAEERLERLEQAVAQLPELLARQAEAAQRAGHGKEGERIRARQPRVSTTDAEARVMRRCPTADLQPRGQRATGHRHRQPPRHRRRSGHRAGRGQRQPEGQPMRAQVEQRTGRKVRQHLLDGGYQRSEDIEQAHREEVELFLPPKTARLPANRGMELQAQARRQPGDPGLEAAHGERRRQGDLQATGLHQRNQLYVNADLRTQRGLTQIAVRRTQEGAMCRTVVRSGLQPHALRASPPRLNSDRTARKTPRVTLPLAILEPSTRPRNIRNRSKTPQTQKQSNKVTSSERSGARLYRA